MAVTGQLTKSVPKITTTQITLEDYPDSLPSAGETYRGQLVVVLGDSGVADKLYMCLKASGGTYSWKEVQAG